MAKTQADRFGTKSLTKDERIERNKEQGKLMTKIAEKRIQKIKDAGLEKAPVYAKRITQLELQKIQIKKETRGRINAIEDGEERQILHAAPYTKKEQAEAEKAEKKSDK